MSGFQVSSAKAERHGLDHGARTEVGSNEEPMRASHWDGGKLKLLFILPMMSGCSGMGKDPGEELQY